MTAYLCAGGKGSTERQMLRILDEEWVIAGKRSSKGHCELFLHVY